MIATCAVRDDDACLGRRRAAQFQDEAPDTRVPRGEAVVVDQVLPDRNGVPSVDPTLRMTDAGFDLPFAIGIADAARQGDHAVVREHIAIERIHPGRTR